MTRLVLASFSAATLLAFAAWWLVGARGEDWFAVFAAFLGSWGAIHNGIALATGHKDRIARLGIDESRPSTRKMGPVTSTMLMGAFGAAGYAHLTFG